MIPAVSVENIVAAEGQVQCGSFYLFRAAPTESDPRRSSDAIYQGYQERAEHAGTGRKDGSNG